MTTAIKILRETSCPILFSKMNWPRLSDYLLIPKDFDAQLEAYLLADSVRRDRVETTVNLGNLRYQSEQVMIKGEWVERDWLTATGVVQETLRDGQEIVLTVLKGTDGSFFDSVILKVQKQNGETRLIYREPLVILERLKGKNTPSKVQERNTHVFIQHLLE